jgi:hypothetical protein
MSSDVDHGKTLGKDVRSSVVVDITDHVQRSSGETADRCEGFGESAEIEIYLVHQSEVFRRAPAARPHDTAPVCIVHEQACAVFFLQVTDVREVGQVAPHSEHALGDDEHPSPSELAGGLELFLEIVHVVVLEETILAAGQESAVDHAGVGELVDDDGVAPVDDRGHRAEHPQIAVVEENRGLFLLEPGELFLERLVQGRVSRQHPGTHGGGRTVFFRGLDRDPFYFIVSGQTEVVVDRPYDVLFAVELHFGPRVVGENRPGKIFIIRHAKNAKVSAVLVAFIENIHGKPLALLI